MVSEAEIAPPVVLKRPAIVAKKLAIVARLPPPGPGETAGSGLLMDHVLLIGSPGLTDGVAAGELPEPQGSA